PDVVVEDIFIVGLGDSFASGDGNPDKPVQFSAARQMVYDPKLLRDEVAMGPRQAPPAAAFRPGGFGLASGDDNYDPKILPRRLMEDELAEKYYRLSSPQFQAAFDKAAPQWLSRDCHRSQYGYPFRVGLELALENRHRAVTFATFTCGGAEAAHLFVEKEASEDLKYDGGKGRPQLDQLADLICRGGAAAPTHCATSSVPTYKPGNTAIEMRRITKNCCPPQARKRPIDVVLLSIGGNDVGFAQLVGYAMTEGASDFAPIAVLAGSSIRFGPDVSRHYLDMLDK